MNKNCKIIIIPGLGKKIKNAGILDWWWKRNNIEMMIFQSRWKSDESYQTKLNRLIALIDKESKNNKISLIGTSAGGSLAINAFNKKSDKINKVITICSRLIKGQDSGRRGFINSTRNYPSFGESIKASEKNIKSFLTKDKKRIMTVRAKFWDEFIPSNTAIIIESKNITVPTGGHLFSIWSSLSWYSKQLREFIETEF